MSSKHSRSNSKAHHYHVLAPTSQVDESLFGASHIVKSDNTASEAKNGPRQKQGGTIQLVLKDLIQNLRIPTERTEEEREAQREGSQKKREEDMRAREEWKRKLLEADRSRKKNQASTELDLKAKDHAQRLMEQEDEIKTLNRRLLGFQVLTACHGQIQEKKRIQAERLEEERLAEMREKELIKNRLEREAQFEAKQRKIKKDRELVIDSVRARLVIEREKQKKAQQDELRVQRDREMKDREQRRQEKELCTKKAQEKVMLREALLEAIHCKKQQLLIEADREKAESKRVMDFQHEAEMKRKEEDEKKRLQKKHLYGEALRDQLKQREQSAAAKRSEALKEGRRLVEEDQQRRVLLDEYKAKKLKEFMATRLPEKYLREKERKAGLPPLSTTAKLNSNNAFAANGVAVQRSSAADAGGNKLQLTYTEHGKGNLQVTRLPPISTNKASAGHILPAGVEGSSYCATDTGKPLPSYVTAQTRAMEQHLKRNPLQLTYEEHSKGNLQVTRLPLISTKKASAGHILPAGVEGSSYCASDTGKPFPSDVTAPTQALKRLQKKHLNGEALRDQLKQREQSAAAKRSEALKEGRRLVEEHQQKRVLLDEYKAKKLKEFMAARLPEKYLREKERKAGLPPLTRTAMLHSNNALAANKVAAQHSSAADAGGNKLQLTYTEHSKGNLQVTRLPPICTKKASAGHILPAGVEGSSYCASDQGNPFPMMLLLKPGLRNSTWSATPCS